jgi:AraC-like DNA-binding protein
MDISRAKQNSGLMRRKSAEIGKPPIRTLFAPGRPGHVLDADYFYFDTAMDEEQPLAILCGGHEKCAPDYLVVRRTYPFHVVKYTLKGRGVFHTPAGEFPLRPGILSGFTPAVAHRFESDPHSPLEHVFVAFAGHEASDLLKQASLADGRSIDTAGTNLIEGLMLDLMKTGMDKPDFAHELCCSQLRTILIRVAASLRYPAAGIPLPLASFRRCRNYIDRNFSSIASSGAVAGACGVNVRYMARLFQQYGSMSPQQYLTRLKMNKAASLILNTPLPIHEIARQVGYEDPYHFSRNFKKQFGQSPRHFRQTHASFDPQEIDDDVKK